MAGLILRELNGRATRVPAHADQTAADAFVTKGIVKDLVDPQFIIREELERQRRIWSKIMAATAPADVFVALCPRQLAFWAGRRQRLLLHFLIAKEVAQKLTAAAHYDWYFGKIPLVRAQ
jgi:hypothetical protein